MHRPWFAGGDPQPPIDRVEARLRPTRRVQGRSTASIYEANMGSEHGFDLRILAKITNGAATKGRLLWRGWGIVIFAVGENPGEKRP